MKKANKLILIIIIIILTIGCSKDNKPTIKEKKINNKINTSIANGEYSPDMPMWREEVRKILEELKEIL